jgi:hypothetical protein
MQVLAQQWFVRARALSHTVGDAHKIAACTLPAFYFVFLSTLIISKTIHYLIIIMSDLDVVALVS